MKITVYVPKKNEKWKVKISGGVLKRINISAVYAFVERNLDKISASWKQEKLILVVDYGQLQGAEAKKGEWINKSVHHELNIKEIMADLTYFIADYLPVDLARTCYKKYLPGINY